MVQDALNESPWKRLNKAAMPDSDRHRNILLARGATDPGGAIYCVGRVSENCAGETVIMYCKPFEEGWILLDPEEYRTCRWMEIPPLALRDPKADMARSIREAIDRTADGEPIRLSTPVAEMIAEMLEDAQDVE